MDFNDVLKVNSQGTNQEKVGLAVYFLDAHKNEAPVETKRIKEVIKNSRSSLDPDHVYSYLNRLEQSKLLKKTGEGYILTIEGSKHFNEKLSLEKAIDSSGELDEIISELKTIERSLDKKYEVNYIQETINALEAECWRSSIVLGWGVFMNKLYLKMEEYGLKECGKIARKNDYIEGEIKQYMDFNKIGDNDSLVLATKIGIFTDNFRKQIKSQLDTRNNCAHVCDYRPKKQSVKHFFEEILNAIEVVEENEFSSVNEGFIREIQNSENIQDLPLSGKQVEGAVEEIFEKLKAIDSFDQAKDHRNYFDYLRYILEESKDSNIQRDIVSNLMRLLRLETCSVSYRNNLIGYATTHKEFREMAEEDPEILDDIILSFSKSQGFNESKEKSGWIRNCEPFLNQSQIKRIAREVTHNDQIYKCKVCRSNLKPILETHEDAVPDEVKEGLRKYKYLN